MSFMMEMNAQSTKKHGNVGQKEKGKRVVLQQLRRFETSKEVIFFFNGPKRECTVLHGSSHHLPH